MNMQAAAVDRGEFIGAMRAIASTVAVVTTDGEAGRHGATVSSFCSVSADPPSMLVCLFGESRIADLVSRNCRFCINILDHGFEHVGDRFAGKHDREVGDRFDGIAWQSPQAMCPALANAVSFQCSVATNNLSGSHRVIIGIVERIEGSVSRPLTYLDGAYRPWSY